MTSINRYRSLKIEEYEKNDGSYMRHLGGGEKKWDDRGAFQLELLVHLGLSPQDKLVDYGCGPLRAGRFIIDYLKEFGYIGIDFNKDFIEIARSVVAGSPALRAKNPKLIHKPEFLDIEDSYDFMLMFSVLNHCEWKEKSQLLETARRLRPSQKIVVTHAQWLFQLEQKHTSGFVARRIEQVDLPKELDVVSWGWAPKDRKVVFPIAEISKPN